MNTRISTDARVARGAIGGAIAVLLALLFAITLLPGQALAESGSEAAPEENIDASFEELMAMSDAEGIELLEGKHGMQFALGRDYVWAGEYTRLDGVTVDNDLLLAGSAINVANATVGGSIRVAGDAIAVKDAKVTENITVAGNTLEVSGGKANDVAMAGNMLTYGGTCSTLHVYGNKVYIDGTVNGDAYVGANSIELGPHANITGTLHASAPESPFIGSGAQVGDVDYSPAQANGFAYFTDVDFEGLFTVIGSVLAGLAIFLGIVGTVLVALFAELFCRRQTAGAANLIRTRTGKTIATGVIGTIVGPIVFAILCVLIVTLPLAGVLGFVMVGLAIAAEGFLGASIFKLVFPKMGRIKAALLGGLIVGVLGVIPYLRTIVAIVAIVYLVGTMLQGIFLSMRDPSDQPVIVDETVGF